jgi:uncharacterized repeat protein (TIGR01451 family)
MNKFIFFFSFLLPITSFSQNELNNNSIDKIKPQSAVFEENKGQMKDQFWKSRPDVLYYGASEGMNYYIKNSGMSYQLSRVESWKDEEDLTHSLKQANDDCKQVPDQIGTYRVDADWLDANPSFKVVKGKELDGYNNYYNVPEGVEPALFVRKYEAITLKNVWDGIDLHYFGTDGFLETDYLVAPGADYKKIQIQFKGAELSTDENGNLIIKTPFGEIQEGALKVYQNNERIEAYWKISDDNVVSFEIPNYNEELALRIDPLTRVWGTYYGGSLIEEGNSTSIDAMGNVYLAGATASTTTIASGGFQNSFGGGSNDAFLVKFSSSGVRIWGTYYGGGGADEGLSCSLDASGNIYLAGGTSSNTGIALAGHQNTKGGVGDAFLVKFSSSGLRIWGTYYGGGGHTIGHSCSTDASGNIYLSGATSSWQSAIASGGFQNTLGGDYDAFLVKFSSSGARIWGTYYGGEGEDGFRSCSTDPSGNIYLAGHTGVGFGGWTSTTGIASAGHQNSIGGEQDAFLVKFSSSGARIWGTYYGGGGTELGETCFTDASGNVYLAGYTSSNTGIASGGFQNLYGGGTYDAFLVRFNSSGVRQWGTYYGGTSSDYSKTCTLDASGNVYLVGRTSSSTGIASGGFQNSYGGGTDAFLVKFNSSGIRKWGTYYGGAGSDFSNSCSLDASGNIYLAGTTSSTSGIASGGFQNSFGGGTNDAFFVKFNQPKVNGYVWQDINGNCIKEFSEIGIDNVINLIIQPGNIICQTIGGIWSVDSLPSGNYTITIDTTLNWIPTCPITQSFTVTNPNGFTVGPDFGLISTNPCSDPDVSIYAPFLRPCLPNQMIYVNACNQTTATGALNASYVDVELDPLMTVTGSSFPYTNQGNNIYRFQTGTLNPGQCVNFNISTTISSSAVSCAYLLGLTLCMDANLYPVQLCALDTIPSDTISNDGTGGTLNGFPQRCNLPWDQSSLSVDGWCQGDSVYFSITNTGEPGGGDMECYSPMWITIDGVVTYTDSIMIPGGQTITLAYPGDGATWILNAEQHPLHPGNSHPNAHVEACGDSTNWTPDNVNDFPQDDADPVVDIYCGVVIGSYDPNDKMGYPIGQTDQKYIQPNQQLQYVIRFQNTGTDTAFTVVIRDTLDTDLNIFTVTSGVSSHQYDFRMYGPRVLEWTFNNINLPDSTTDQEGSNGFVTFHVDQVPNLSPGTEITNDADIYFDFNDPITTNTTIHRIFEGFVSVLNIEDLTQEGKTLLVYPNPTSNNITIQGKEGMNQNFKILDQMGREVISGKLNGISTEVNLSFLSNGMYTLKIEGNYQPAEIVKE